MTKTKTKRTTRSHVSKKKPTGLHHQVAHHAKRAFHATPKFVHGMVFGAFVGVMIVGVVRANTVAHAQGVSTPDCEANSVIWCGASTPSDVLKDYNDGDGHNSASTIQAIYAGFGIDRADVEGMSSDSQSGYVTKTGYVYIGNTEVAKDVITGGRDNIAGSTKANYGPQIFYKRPPSVSFEDSQLEALVVMKNNVFQFAILVSCGNPVTGTPTTSPPKPTPTPTPTPPATPQPALGCSWLHADQGTVQPNGDQDYTLSAEVATFNGATVSNYKFVFGDGATSTIDSSATTASIVHLYPPGTWNAYVTIDSGNAPAATCLATVTVNKPGVPTPPTTPTTPVSTITTTPTSVTALPNTGPGAVIVIAIASVVGGYVFHMGHRHIRNKRRANHHHTTHHHPHRPAHAH